jgi:hypothetical protein
MHVAQNLWQAGSLAHRQGWLLVQVWRHHFWDSVAARNTSSKVASHLDSPAIRW